MATISVSEETVTVIKKTVTVALSEAEGRRVAERLSIDPKTLADDGVDLGPAILAALDG